MLDLGFSSNPPVLQFALVIVELDAPGVLHAAHDVDHILLVDPHDGR